MYHSPAVGAQFRWVVGAGVPARRAARGLPADSASSFEQSARGPGGRARVLHGCVCGSWQARRRARFAPRAASAASGRDTCRPTRGHDARARGSPPSPRGSRGRARRARSRRLVPFHYQMQMVRLDAEVQNAEPCIARGRQGVPRSDEELSMSEGGHGGARSQRHVDGAVAVVGDAPAMRDGATAGGGLASGASRRPPLDGIRSWSCRIMRAI
jgi:hypothetical protein